MVVATCSGPNSAQCGTNSMPWASHSAAILRTSVTPPVLATSAIRGNSRVSTTSRPCEKASTQPTVSRTRVRPATSSSSRSSFCADASARANLYLASKYAGPMQLRRSQSARSGHPMEFLGDVRDVTAPQHRLPLPEFSIIRDRGIHPDRIFGKARPSQIKFLGSCWFKKGGIPAMPMDKLAGTAAEALADVADGATVFISGFGGAGFPNVLIHPLRDRSPKQLTLVVNSATHRYSVTHELIEAGLVRKVVCTAARGHSKEPSPFELQWMDGKIELECVPQGTFAERIRAGGAGIPAFYMPIGLGTELAQGKEVRRFGDREYILEQAIKGDLALVRADIADRYGNLTFRYAQMNFGPVMATAAARVVVEVRAVLEEPIP